ncbi:hypothetical protein Gpo141_00009734 [Globisporangium polare]
MKVSFALSVAAVASLAALTPQTADAHGYISQPKASYKPNTIYTNFNAEITASVNKGFSGKVFNQSPEQNTQAFTEAWPSTGYTSLKEMLDPYAPDCGLSLPDATPVDVSSMKEFKFQNNEYKEGFIASHRGPCELWIGDTKAWHYDDCANKFPGYPATIPTDFSVCKGTCRVTFYWLALHSSNWQIYKQCVPVKNGSGSSSTTPAATTTKAPAATTKAPPATTTKPTAKAPAATTAKPAVTTAKPKATPSVTPSSGTVGNDSDTPAPSSKKCTKIKN